MKKKITTTEAANIELNNLFNGEDEKNEFNKVPIINNNYVNLVLENNEDKNQGKKIEDLE